MNKKLDSLFKTSSRIAINEDSRLVIMSDCHRGTGNNFDNFLKNQNIYKAALQHYYNKGFTYIELGDGDDMWEVKDCKEIVDVYLDIFKLLKDFHDSKRLIMIYGNHDITKKSEEVLKNCFYKYYDNVTEKYENLLEGLVVYESLVLNYKDYDIFLLHGHQIDFLNSTIWRVSRLLVRYLWRTLEYLGIKDPTSAAKNYKSAKSVEKKLAEWSNKNNKIIIAGHTHRAIFPKVGQGLYFNDGSCIHPNGITCLEIENGKISLVKWEYDVNKKDLISVKRKVLEGKEFILNFFK